MPHLDRTNLRILELLQRNGRMAVSDLARVVSRGETTVRERVAALERDGLISGYHAWVDLEALGYGVRAVVRAGCDSRELPNLARRLAAIPNVISATVVTGEKPVRIEVVAEDLARLERVMSERLAPLGLTGLEAAVMLQWLVKQRPPPVSLDGTTAPAPGGNGHEVPASAAKSPESPFEAPMALVRA